MARIYDREIPLDKAIRITRVKMFLLGHTFPSIDAMSIQDFGDVLAYWFEDNNAEQKLAKERESLKRKR